MSIWCRRVKAVPGGYKVGDTVFSCTAYEVEGGSHPVGAKGTVLGPAEFADYRSEDLAVMFDGCEVAVEKNFEELRRDPLGNGASAPVLVIAMCWRMPPLQQTQIEWPCRSG